MNEATGITRVLIGLGTGRTSVQANVQVFELTPQGQRKVETRRRRS